jgi:TM2 domain-containing membrane protein YozV
VPAPPAPASYYPPVSGYPTAYPGYAPAYDPYTGQPYSDKSKVTAGLLQLLLAAFLALPGIGRLYAGNTTMGGVQLGLAIVAWLGTICAAVLIVPIFLLIGVWIWGIVDGILLLTGRPIDGQGRLLR